MGILRRIGLISKPPSSGGGGGGGTLTAVTATLPLTSSGGTTPVIAANSNAASGLLKLDGSGFAPATTMPALAGDVSTTAGGVATVIGAHKVTDAMRTQMAANTVKTNATSSTADGADTAMPASTFLVRLAAGNIVAGTVAQVITLLALVAANISDFSTAVLNLAVSKVNGGRETLSTNATSGAAATLDLANGNVHDLTLTASCTLTFTVSAAGSAASFTLIARQDGTGSRVITWPASVKWAGGVAPTISTVASRVDVLSFLTIDNGTTWLGFTGGIGIR